MVATLKGTRQSSYQVRDYVLCRDCEQLLSREGEDYVMRLIHQDGRFPFLDLLNSHGLGLVVGEFRLYSAEMTHHYRTGKTSLLCGKRVLASRST